MVHACLYVCWCASVYVVGVGAVMCEWVCVGVYAIVCVKSRAHLPDITHTHTNLTALMRPRLRQLLHLLLYMYMKKMAWRTCPATSRMCPCSARVCTHSCVYVCISVRACLLSLPMPVCVRVC